MWLFLSVFLTPVSASYVTSPANCLQEKIYPCAVLTKGKSTLAHGGNGFYTSGNSVVSFVGPQELYVVRGSLWAIAKKQLVVKTTFARFSTEVSESEFWINAGSDKQELKVFQGSVGVAPKGATELTVLAGREVYVSSVDYAKKSCYVSNVGVIDFQAHVRTYGNVFQFGLLSVEEHLEKVAGAVLIASSQDSSYLQKQVARQLASDHEAEVRQKRQAVEASRLENYLRRLFRIKSNFEE